MTQCARCPRTESIKWWKCCPEHVSEQGDDVLCSWCAVELHPNWTEVRESLFMQKMMVQVAPWPEELFKAVNELQPTAGLTGWKIWLDEEDRGQGCHGLTLNIAPNNSDSYHPEKPLNTRFLYPVPAAAFNRDSWEEWLWARIEETEGHERAEGFRFVAPDGTERRPFKPLHADGFDPGVIRRLVSESDALIPNAGRVVTFPCKACTHYHNGKMGEGFRIAEDRGCLDPACQCGKVNPLPIQ